MKRKISLIACIWFGANQVYATEIDAKPAQAKDYAVIIEDYLRGEDISNVRSAIEGLGYVCGGQGEVLVIQGNEGEGIEDQITISALERVGVLKSEEDVICFEGSKTATTLYLSKNLISNKSVWQDFFFYRVPKGHIIFTKFSQYSGAVARTVHLNCDGLEICPYPVRQRDTLGSYSDEDYDLSTISGLELGFGVTFSKFFRDDTRFNTFLCGKVGVNNEACIHTWRDHLDSRLIKDQWVSITSADGSHLMSDVNSVIPIETNNDEFRLAELQKKAAEIQRQQQQQPNRSANDKTAFAKSICTANLPQLGQIFEMKDDVDMDYALDLVLGSNEKITPFLVARVIEIYEQPELAEQGMTSGGWMTSCVFELSK